jgi:hypothetical protein
MKIVLMCNYLKFIYHTSMEFDISYIDFDANILD